MSDPKDMRPRDAWDAVEDGLFDEELEGLGELTPEQVKEQLAAMGIDAEGGRRILEKVVSGAAEERGEEEKEPAQGGAGGSTGGGAPAPVQKVVSLAEARERRRGLMGRPVLWSLAAAAAVLLVVGVVERERVGAQIDAWLGPAPTAQPSEGPKPPPPGKVGPTPLERAAALREAAQADVEMGYNGEALDALEQAYALDPAGAMTDAVRDLRAKAAAPRKSGEDYRAKPGPANWEKPLEKKKHVVH